jgi:hypothetical protein
VKTPKDPRKSLRQSAVGLSALLLLGSLSGTAIAATDIKAPCPELASASDAMDSFIATESTETIARTVDAVETISSKPLADNALNQPASDADDSTAADDSSAEDAKNPELTSRTSRLPGVSANDLPGFRRHMYRTDI